MSLKPAPVSTSNPRRGAREACSGSRGFTLSEVIVVVFLVAIMATVVIGSVQNSLQRARMAECFVELRGIQAALWHDMDGGNQAIDPASFWKRYYKDSKPGPYVLLVNVDTSGITGAGPASENTDSNSRSDPQFVVVGRYAHWAPGRYVFIEDDNPPRLVTGPDEDPGWGRQIDWENGREFGVGDVPAGTGPGVSWAGARTTGLESSATGSGFGSSRNLRDDGGGSSTSSSTNGGSRRTTSSSIGD